MREKVEAVLIELESIKLSERSSLLSGSEAVKLFWDDLEALEKKLNIYLKAGDIADFSDEEVPLLIDKAKTKIADMLSLIQIEKNREVIRIKEISNLRDLAGREVQLQRRVQVVHAPKPDFIDDAFEWFRINRGPLESFVATSMIVIIIQFCLNVFFINQYKQNTQFSLIDPLEQELELRNKHNIQLQKQLSALQKEVGFYRSLPLMDTFKKANVKGNSSSALTFRQDRSPSSIQTILSR